MAALAVALYILELFRVIPSSWMPAFLWINFLIDFIFLIDLVAKCIILGRSYLKSPWFLIDVISTLPIISSFFELLGAIVPQLQATRVARSARIARVARIARLAKVARVARLATAIRARHGLTFLKSSSALQETPAFNKSLFFGVPVLLLAFWLASSYITNNEVSKLRTTITKRIEQAKTQADLEFIMKEYDVATALYPTIESTEIHSPINGGQSVPVSLSGAYTRADQFSGILILLLLLTIAVSIQMSSALAKDRSKGRERSLLSQCFSPPIISKFYSDPEVIERYFNQWMTVFFIDIRGFTKVAEKDAEDVEGLALKLRRVMDIACNEIVVTHKGVIDKFMGDAVMGWVGGHFSIHWSLLSDVRRQLYLDELDLIEQDINSIQREIKQIDPETNARSSENRHLQFEPILKEAREEKLKLQTLQKTALEKDSKLQSSHRQLMEKYRQQVARSAVICCLKISQEVEKTDDPEAFQKLKIGIGSGPVLVGNFGSTDQIGFTILGPTVNRSARLEPASAQCGCNILIDQNTYDLLKDYDDLRFRRVPLIKLTGLSESAVTYEPFLANSVTKAFLEQFEMGVKALEQGNNQEAIACFSQADALRPRGDTASKLWSKECEKALLNGDLVGVKSMNK
ncbi:MAG: hypothetical protein GY751_26635 [Bacteroidetes bacterium]|nr:hypothetical protein [Bacteroidota bacterium]